MSDTELQIDYSKFQKFNGKNFKLSELEGTINKQEIETARQAKADLKASAKAKLIAGEPLTEEEANTIVI